MGRKVRPLGESQDSIACERRKSIGYQSFVVGGKEQTVLGLVQSSRSADGSDGQYLIGLVSPGSYQYQTVVPPKIHDFVVDIGIDRRVGTNTQARESRDLEILHLSLQGVPVVVTNVIRIPGSHVEIGTGIDPHLWVELSGYVRYMIRELVVPELMDCLAEGVWCGEESKPSDKEGDCSKSAENSHGY